MDELLVGCASLNTTPPLGIRLAGYAARKDGAGAVLDELSTTALYLAQGDCAAVLIGVDVCTLPQAFVVPLRERVADQCGLPASQVMINSSHTHYGPALQGGELEDRHRASLIDKAASAASWARSRAVPARLSRGREPVLLGMNRRERRADGVTILGENPGGSVLPHVDVLRFDDERGAPVALVFAHACHGTTMRWDCTQITADFIGVARRMITDELGCPALFLQGCGADINPYPRRDYRDVVNLGRRLGHAVLKQVTELPEASDVSRLRVCSGTVNVPLENAPASLAAAQERCAAAEAALAAADPEHDDGWRLYRLNRAADQARETVEAMTAGTDVTCAPLETWLLALDDLAIIGWPAEVLSTVGRPVIEGAPFAQTVALGYTNGWYGYLPDEAVFDELGYEHEARIHRLGLPIGRQAGADTVRQSLALLATLQTG